jgi:hypothetical protein
MRHRLATLVGSSALLVGALAGPAAAAGAQHDFYPEDYDAYEHFAAGEGFCVDWAGTFHEVRRGGYRLVAAKGGQQPGELHVNGAIDGLVELIPDDPALPTYAGTYREKVNAVVTSFSDEGDVERVGQYRLRSTLHGSDGSSYELRLSGKTTFNASGVLTVQRETFTCS